MENQVVPPPDEPVRPKRNNTWIYLLIILLLLGTNIYLFFQKKETAKQTIVIKEQLQHTSSEKETLQKEYDAALARLDELTSQNSKLRDQLKSQNSDITKTKARIQSILSKEKASATELKEARSLIAGLNVKITDYEQQIAALKKTNEALTVERDSILKDNLTLQDQIDLAKVLHASNIRLKAIDLRRGGRKERETERAKRVDLIRITFDIDENRLQEGGMKELHIRIVNPNGDLLSNAALGSGSFTDVQGETRYYSLAKTIELTTGVPVKDIDVDWRQSASYEKGTYLVEIFHQGYLIGKGKVFLR